MSAIIAHDRKNLSHVGKIETLPTFLIRPRHYQGCLRFVAVIGRQNLGRSGNCENPDRLGFSRHVKTMLKSSFHMSGRKILDDRAGISQFPDRPRFCQHIGKLPDACPRSIGS